MTLYILDTDTVSLFQRGHPLVRARCDACPPDQLAGTVITVEEQLSGWYTMLRKAKLPSDLAHAYRRLTDTVRFLSRIQILTYTEEAIHRYNALASLRLGVGKMDLRIAAIALELGGTVVTRNARDFNRVPGLVIEDWTV